MLQLKPLTSSSNINYIDNFEYLYELARCSKCQMFIAFRGTNKLYGATDDCCCIHEINVPFTINSDLHFRLNKIDKRIFDSNKNFFIPDQFNWVILPEYYWNMYIGGDLITEYDYDSDQYIILDKTTKTPIDQIQMYKCRDCNDFDRMNFLNQLTGLFSRINTLMPPVSFFGLENDVNIRKAFDNKTSMGRVLCRMKNEYTDVVFYFYKGLFSLAKADTLSMDVQFDKYETKLFLATFKPKKKKNPITLPTFDFFFEEKIYCMFANMI